MQAEQVEDGFARWRQHQGSNGAGLAGQHQGQAPPGTPLLEHVGHVQFAHVLEAGIGQKGIHLLGREAAAQQFLPRVADQGLNLLRAEVRRCELELHAEFARQVLPALLLRARARLRGNDHFLEWVPAGVGFAERRLQALHLLDGRHNIALPDPYSQPRQVQGLHVSRPRVPAQGPDIIDLAQLQDRDARRLVIPQALQRPEQPIGRLLAQGVLLRQIQHARGQGLEQAFDFPLPAIGLQQPPYPLANLLHRGRWFRPLPHFF